jgi:hypothetical protein
MNTYAHQTGQLAQALGGWIHRGWHYVQHLHAFGPAWQRLRFNVLIAFVPFMKR